MEEDKSYIVGIIRIEFLEAVKAEFPNLSDRSATLIADIFAQTQLDEFEIAHEINIKERLDDLSRNQLDQLFRGIEPD